MNYNPILALLTGAGEGVDALQQRNRQRRLDEQNTADRDQDRRIAQANATLLFEKNRRDMGLRTPDEIEQELTSDTGKALGGVVGVPVVGAVDAAIDRNRGEEIARGPRQTYVDPSGLARDFVYDPGSTPEAKAMRKLAETTSREQAKALAEQREREAAAQRSVVEKQRQAYETLKTMFPTHALAKSNFDQNNPKDYVTALTAANSEQHDIRVAGAQADHDNRTKKDPDALPPAQANQVKLQQTALLNMQRSLKALEDAVKEGGTSPVPGSAYHQKLKALQADAQIQFKEAANLGALSGPDMGLVNAAIGSPTSIFSPVSGGKEGVLSSLGVANQSILHRAQTMENVYGIKMPAAFYGDQSDAAPLGNDTRQSAPLSGGKQTITADQVAFLRNKKGMTDAQIRARYTVTP